MNSIVKVFFFTFYLIIWFFIIRSLYDHNDLIYFICLIILDFSSNFVDTNFRQVSFEKIRYPTEKKKNNAVKITLFNKISGFFFSFFFFGDLEKGIIAMLPVLLNWSIKCRVQTNCQLVGPGPAGEVPSVEIFLRDPSPYSRDFLNKVMISIYLLNLPMV